MTGKGRFPAELTEAARLRALMKAGVTVGLGDLLGMAATMGDDLLILEAGCRGDAG